MKEIEKIIKAYDSLDKQKEKAALATVVSVEASAYRRVGARLLVSSSGNWVGGISGGCLEGDALKRAQLAIFKNASSLVVYDTLEDDAHQIGVGLGCNGKIEVLFTPIDFEDKDNPIEQIRKINNCRTPSFLIQFLEKSEAKLFGKVIQFQDAHTCLTASDVQILEEKKSAALLHERSSILQLPSGQRILLECILPKIRVLLVGEHYDINAFLEIADTLAWESHVVSSSKKLKHFSSSSKVYHHALAKIQSFPIDPFTAIILMSHDYKTDLHLLPHFLKSNSPYIGLLGPKSRTLKMQAEDIIRSHELNLLQQPNLYSPTGLNIGAESPEEIALSICAEIIAVFRKRPANFLRDLKGPIH